MVRIEIDGKELDVEQGKMVIEAADEAGIAIPRFCYHKKLSIAANCRMCLVEVTNAPKALPACATPVSDGMKVFTQSPKAKAAQQAVMEFLLINHPLDCPICDQGGQCELQDLALMVGRDSSQFEEGKRAVKDKNLGALIATEMTRCIHCTRCVRFGDEIAGVRELGATGRGEFLEIGTYIEQSVDSEMSGNVIDLCPVGALTSKPSRFGARAWEMQAYPSISMHDCVGSNLYFYTQRGEIEQALPRENEALNEVWLSDRDRFSYEGLTHPDRLQKPLIKKEGKWQETDWETALTTAVEKLKAIDSDKLAAIASPNATLEEFYLLQKLMRDKGCHHLDYRLQAQDFSHQDKAATYPGLGIDLTALPEQEVIILVGSDIRKEQPMIAHWVRKAQLAGAKVIVINAFETTPNFECEQIIDLDLAKALDTLKLDNKKTSILLGFHAITHPQAAQIYRKAKQLAKTLDATFGEMSLGANSAGGAITGFLPHRALGGESASGQTIQQFLAEPKQGYLLFNCEPEFDCANPQLAINALNSAMVVACTPYDSPKLREYADIILPITPPSEMRGTYVNGQGLWQPFYPATKPLVESKPGWKVLRVLANFWDAKGFDYESTNAIIDELKDKLAKIPYFADSYESVMEDNSFEVKGLMRIAPVGLYQGDAIVRRAKSLQQTKAAQQNIQLNQAEADKLSFKVGDSVRVKQGEHYSKLMVLAINNNVLVGSVIVPAAIAATAELGGSFMAVTLVRGS